MFSNDNSSVAYLSRSFLSIGVPSGSAELGSECAENASCLEVGNPFEPGGPSLLPTFSAYSAVYGSCLSSGFKIAGILINLTSPLTSVTARKTPSIESLTSNGKSRYVCPGLSSGVSGFYISG